MRQVNIHEAESTLSKLVEAAEAGEKVILARGGRPVAQIVRLERPGGVRLGTLKGQIPAELIDAVSQPLSAKDSARLFAGDLER
jgi:antitoxin (DNA-binding transcriptional repressor) of toxin-antitoxin stability system